ncbi:gamma-type small acid-soluble spore protein [Lysinibacillus sp. LZ02]|uniref:gamma-type small acid-soluble spore protein n=1 Tax=Lysinibacillus sp. LZ02 TaxID=3420668 RepID=UPI003D36823A
MTNNNNDKFTSSGTNIDDVKRKNAASGLSYNQIKRMLVQVDGYDTTNNEEIAKEFYHEKNSSNKNK